MSVWGVFEVFWRSLDDQRLAPRIVWNDLFWISCEVLGDTLINLHVERRWILKFADLERINCFFRTRTTSHFSDLSLLRLKEGNLRYHSASGSLKLGHDRLAKQKIIFHFRLEVREEHTVNFFSLKRLHLESIWTRGNWTKSRLIGQFRNGKNFFAKDSLVK